LELIRNEVEVKWNLNEPKANLVGTYCNEVEVIYMRKWKKCMCAVMASALMVSSMTGCGSGNTDNVVAGTIEEDKAGELEEAIESQISTDNATDADKEETVYVMSDASGNVNNVIVSAWLKNEDSSDALNDYTSLKDIENVKTDGSYVTNDDGTITWQADGEDVYYQGTTDKELPVDVKISYTLDGKSVTPEELAGASGKVTIRFDYTNNTITEVKVGDNKKKVITPFVMLSGIMLPTDKFSNVEVNNGKVISEGNNIIVVGYGAPGLKDCLVEGLTEDKVKSTIEDMDIPEYVEVTADVTDFSLDMTLTMGLSDVLSSDGDMLGDIDFSDLNSQVDLLGSSADELVDGTDTLQSGITTLASGTSTLYTGTKDLATGADSLKTYTGQLAEGTGKLAEAVGTLDTGITSLKTGASSLKTGSKSLYTGSKNLRTGIVSVYDGENTLSEGLGTIIAGYEGEKGAVAGAKSVADGTTQVKNGIATMVTVMNSIPTAISAQASAIYDKLAQNGINVTSADGIKMYLDGMEADGAISSEELPVYKTLSEAYYTVNALNSVASTITTQLSQYSSSITQLTEGAASLETGAKALSDGVSQLYAGTKQASTGLDTLITGTKTLKEGADDLVTGAKSIKDGSKTLYDGTVTLSSGSGQLLTAANTLDTSAKSISKGAVTLNNGVASLVQGASDLNEGAAKLEEGAGTLEDGMNKFNQDGIKKITDMFSADYQSEIDFINAVFDKENVYSTYGGAEENITSTVKFIYETEAIE
jgi:putative membrane protein